jgi:hypothetical protein
VESLAEVLQPDGSTRWELVSLTEASIHPGKQEEEKPTKRSRKATVESIYVEPTEKTDY